MKINTVKFVDASDIFKDCPNMWDAFFESSPECVWGSNNRTLVTKDVITDGLEKVVDREEGTIDTLLGAEVDKAEIEEVFVRLESLPNDVYIDLEN